MQRRKAAFLPPVWPVIVILAVVVVVAVWLH